MKFWIVVFLLWLAWKVIPSILAEAARRRRNQESIDAPNLKQPARTRTLPPVPQRLENPSLSGREPEDELKRLLQEAILQKRQQKTRRPLPTTAEPRSQQPYHYPSPSATDSASLSPAGGTIAPPVPPYVRVRMPSQEQRYPAMRNAAQEAVRPLPKSEAARPLPIPEMERKERSRQSQREDKSFPSTVHPILQMLGKEQIKKSIIIAEMLAAPRGLREFD